MDEICNKKVISKDEQDFTKEFIAVAEKTLAIAKAKGTKQVILKPKSPSLSCADDRGAMFKAI